MPIKFTLTQKGNPSNPSAPKKFYANAKSSGEVSFKTLSKEISQSSTTVSDTDAMAVFNEFKKLLVKHLADGKIVRLEGIGSFQVALSSDGAEMEEKFSTSHIRGGKVAYRPSTDVKEMLTTLKYEKEKK